MTERKQFHVLLGVGQNQTVPFLRYANRWVFIKTHYQRILNDFNALKSTFYIKKKDFLIKLETAKRMSPRYLLLLKIVKIILSQI